MNQTYICSISLIGGFFSLADLRRGGEGGFGVFGGFATSSCTGGVVCTFWHPKSFI